MPSFFITSVLKVRCSTPHLCDPPLAHVVRARAAQLAVDGVEILRDLGGVFPRAIFFVNYLLAVGLVSNFFELLNFPASLVSWCVRARVTACACMASTHARFRARRYRRRKAITSYERARAAKSVPFQVGYEYAYLLALLSMTLLFSTVVPILVPFGILTFATKHLVDRNNLVYVYTSTTHSNAAMVRVVLTQVVIGTAFYQLAMFSFFLFSKADIAKAIVAGLLLVPSGERLACAHAVGIRVALTRIPARSGCGDLRALLVCVRPRAGHQRGRRGASQSARRGGCVS